MGTLNKAQLIGLVGKDAEQRTFESGTTMANFSLATSEHHKDKDGEKKEITTWHNIVMWGKLAENLTQYIKKGNLIFVEGRIANRSYDKDGQTKYVTEIVATNIVLLERKGNTIARSDAPPNQELPMLKDQVNTGNAVEDSSDLPV